MYTLVVQRTDLMDTSPAAWRIMLSLLRNMTPEERALKTFDRIESGRQLRRATEHLRVRETSGRTYSYSAIERRTIETSEQCLLLSDCTDEPIVVEKTPHGHTFEDAGA